MTILHIITSLERGGAETMLAKLTKAMMPLGVRSVVVSLTGAGVYGAELERAGIRVISLEMRRGFFNPMALFRLIGILKQERPDLIQTWLYHADLLGLVAAKLAGLGPLCWNIRCSDMDMTHYSRLSRWLPRLLGFLSRWPDAVLANSHAGQKIHQQLGYRPRAWYVIPNGFDTEQFRPDARAREEMRAALGVAADAPVIGLVARFDPMKDHQTFLAAARILASRHPSAVFVLAGKGVEPGNPAFADALRGGVAGRMLLLGERTDIPQLMNAFDICCLSSLTEGFPNVLGEAMACGVPCVSTDVGDAAWLISDTGLITPPHDPVVLAAAMASLLTLKPEERRQLGSRARQRIVDEFSLPVIARRYYDVYAELVNRRRKKAK